MTSSRSIDTLVADVQSLVRGGKESLDEERLLALGTRISGKVKSSLSKDKKVPSLRMSNLGTPCDRKLWYSVNQPDKAEKLSASAKLKFLFGDILEELLIYLAKEAGHTVENEQREVTLHGVKGHIDCTIDGELVDVKSASTNSFKKFNEHRLEGDDPFGYLMQLNSYLHSSVSFLKEKEAGHFFAIDKQLGHITLDTYPKEYKDYETIIQNKREILSQTSPPEKGYSDKPEGKSGNRKLGIECGYCPFKWHCWADANEGAGLKAYSYSNRPQFLTKVARTPKVLEMRQDECEAW